MNEYLLRSASASNAINIGGRRAIRTISGSSSLRTTTESKTHHPWNPIPSNMNEKDAEDDRRIQYIHP